MTTNKTAAPSGNSKAADNSNVVKLEVYAAPPARKTGRSRYVRLFPERLAFLLLHLEAREFCAYVRFLNHYVVSGGAVLDDRKSLGRVVQLSPRAWPELRAKLINLDLVQAEGGRLIDKDQQTNLDIQSRTSDRQRDRANKRWGNR